MRPGGDRAFGCCLEVEKKEPALFHCHCVLLEPAAAIGNDTAPLKVLAMGSTERLC